MARYGENMPWAQTGDEVHLGSVPEASLGSVAAPRRQTRTCRGCGGRSSGRGRGCAAWWRAGTPTPAEAETGRRIHSSRPSSAPLCRPPAASLITTSRSPARAAATDRTKLLSLLLPSSLYPPLPSSPLERRAGTAAPLFRVRAESEERRVILLAEELERCGVLPRVDGVVPAEVLCVRLLQAEEVRQQLIDDSGRLLAAGEQRGARVFDELGLALREEATTAGRFCAPALEAHEREAERWWLSGGAVACNEDTKGRIAAFITAMWLSSCFISLRHYL